MGGSGGAAATTGGAGNTSGGSGGDGGGGGPATPSSGCGVAPPESGEQTVSVDGEERTYLLDLPPDYDSNTPYPILFGFHGAGTSGSTFRGQFYGNLLSTAGDDAVVVHPNAGGDDAAWDTMRDVPFFDAMLEQLQAQLCIDESRVFAGGHSSGGFFTNTLGCQRGNVLRGIAPVSGGGPLVFGGASCQGPLAAWIAHGENDLTVDFMSGEGSRDYWVEANGCDAMATSAVSPAECVEFQGCDAGFSVHWCVYQDGHDWPSFGAEGIWNFFSGL
jgi:poly(3-hydroxybutyrate) depolymerase